uniref:AAA domain (Dynein-related subfamily) n=1 Tax=Candidatus Kentrum sp. TUN TaxID=2126343 RepID=A0A450ZLK0_9GAMM|nr:MAG: AAA domain (dynein-related subfamily) [Candidatus Kentron sp. TUN]VFK59320.1 MAG: AAA domain (dynein-related subfamily) [Candidatus Kentron sp. TUN]
MSDTAKIARYQGKGKQQSQDAWRDLPEIDKKAIIDPAGYLASQDLAAAVDVASTLGMPLLLTGEPGSGKSRLADSIAWEMGMGKPLEFVVKSDTQAQELFYRYDLIGRYNAARDSNTDDTRFASRFLRLEALGKALLYAKGENLAEKVLGFDDAQIKEQLPDYHKAPRRSVVLINEIDKAPRDVPNDLLAEIDKGEFHIPELEVALQREVRIALAESQQETRFDPLVIITSNSEKALPEAFLRRCIYFHVPFPAFEDDDKNSPEKSVTVERIVESRFYQRYKGHDNLVWEAISFFKFIRRNFDLEHKPSMAELLNWLDYLLRQLRIGKISSGKKLLDIDPALFSLSVRCLLLKKEDDQARAREIIENYRQNQEQGARGA